MIAKICVVLASLATILILGRALTSHGRTEIAHDEIASHAFFADFLIAVAFSALVRAWFTFLTNKPIAIIAFFAHSVLISLSSTRFAETLGTLFALIVLVFG